MKLKNHQRQPVMTAQDFASGSYKPSLWTAVAHRVYLVAIGVATVGWLSLIAWCALALTGY